MATPTGQQSVLATRRGKLILVLLCAVGFLDFVDATIVNVALPSIRRDLHMSVRRRQGHKGCCRLRALGPRWGTDRRAEAVLGCSSCPCPSDRSPSVGAALSEAESMELLTPLDPIYAIEHEAC